MKVKNNKIIYRGEEFPPTLRNAAIYSEWKRVKDKNKRLKLAKKLSTVILDFKLTKKWFKELRGGEET